MICEILLFHDSFPLKWSIYIYIRTRKSGVITLWSLLLSSLKLKRKKLKLYNHDDITHGFFSSRKPEICDVWILMACIPFTIPYLSNVKFRVVPASWNIWQYFARYQMNWFQQRTHDKKQIAPNIRVLLPTLGVLIFAGIYFRELKKNCISRVFIFANEQF